MCINVDIGLLHHLTYYSYNMPITRETMLHIYNPIYHNTC